MGNDLEPVLQTAVMLAVDMFIGAVANTKDLSGGTVRFTTFIDFQLYAKVTGAVAIEDGLGLELVIVNVVTAAGFKAGVAVGRVGVI